VNDLTSVAPLNGVLPPSNIVVLNQIVGAQAVSNAPCATFEMVVMATSSELGDMSELFL
jgi:hypothetical protein